MSLFSINFVSKVSAECKFGTADSAGLVIQSSLNE